MSTWQELREEILFNLSAKTDASTSSDLRNQVDARLKRKRDEIYGLKPPKSLLVSSAVVSVPYNLDYIQIDASGSGTTPGWALTDYWKPYSITVGLSTATASEEEDWEFMEWDTWIRSNSAIEGNQRLNATFSIDYQNRLYLRNLPGSGTTWNARMHYFKVPATIVDAGIPEIGIQHESLLINAVTLSFPHLFRGEERAMIYASLIKMQKDAMQNYLRDQTTIKRASRHRPFSKRRGSSAVMWGTGETS